MVIPLFWISHALFAIIGHLIKITKVKELDDFQFCKVVPMCVSYKFLKTQMLAEVRFLVLLIPSKRFLESIINE